jgi:hypothetical protein
MKPWHIRDPLNYAREIGEVERKYAQLHSAIRGDETRIAGTLPIREGETELDRFAITIDLLANYPDSIPVVHEIGGRIPRVLDRHVIPSSGAACLLLPDQRWELWPKGSTLLSFVEGPVRSYFLGQALVERGNPWPFGEWAHGLRGKLDYYKSLVGTDDPRAICKFLECLQANKVKGHWDCPCMSGRRLRDCHFGLVKDLRARMPRGEAAQSLRQFVLILQHLRKAS